ncbi:hypothetical protein GCM10010335_18690 [Streptomyces galbus]|nr:hypothetical protein GCM10010335_18690 [Streptomyces galbus]
MSLQVAMAGGGGAALRGGRWFSRSEDLSRGPSRARSPYRCTSTYLYPTGNAYLYAAGDPVNSSAPPDCSAGPVSVVLSEAR